MIEFLYTLSKDLFKAKGEYLKTLSSDSYIEYLETQIETLVKYAEEMNLKVKNLEGTIDSLKPSLVLESKHKEILQFFTDNDDKYLYRHDLSQFNKTISDKIIFQELIDSNIIIKAGTISTPLYRLNKHAKMIVFKFLNGQ